ncbi:MAG: glycosyltransferase [Candidatus Saccharimonadales bacterium]
MARVLLAGGGSGGHVTPLKAIISELNEEANVDNLSITVVTDRGFYKETQAIFKDIEKVQLKKIFSGKYRRYKSKSLLWHITHVPTLLKNARDIVLLGAGLVQSIVYFLMHKPDVVFCKGGFVCVPIGFTARLFRVPLIIHDSDTRPGLTNRILARWAQTIATGMPTSFYPYPQQKMKYVGIPVQRSYQPVNSKKQKVYKNDLGLAADRPLLLVTGGGKGAATLNAQITAIARKLIGDGWSIINLAGRGKDVELRAVREALPQSQQQHWQIEEFAEMLPRLLASDLVICRTSASTVQECANAQKAVIGVPSHNLDDQKQNAAFFASKEAIIALDETTFSDDGSELLSAIEQLQKNPEHSQQLAQTLHDEFAKPHAAVELAHIILASTPQ